MDMHLLAMEKRVYEVRKSLDELRRLSRRRHPAVKPDNTNSNRAGGSVTTTNLIYTYIQYYRFSACHTSTGKVYIFT